MQQLRKRRIVARGRRGERQLRFVSFDQRGSADLTTRYDCSSDRLVPFHLEPLASGSRRDSNLSRLVSGHTGSKPTGEQRHNTLGRIVGLALLEDTRQRSNCISICAQA